MDVGTDKLSSLKPGDSSEDLIRCPLVFGRNIVFCNFCLVFKQKCNEIAMPSISFDNYGG